MSFVFSTVPETYWFDGPGDPVPTGNFGTFLNAAVSANRGASWSSNNLASFYLEAIKLDCSVTMSPSQSQTSSIYGERNWVSESESFAERYAKPVTELKRLPNAVPNAEWLAISKSESKPDAELNTDAVAVAQRDANA